MLKNRIVIDIKHTRGNQNWTKYQTVLNEYENMILGKSSYFHCLTLRVELIWELLS